MFMVRSIAETSAQQTDDSFGRYFSSSWFLKIAQPTFRLIFRDVVMCCVAIYTNMAMCEIDM